MLPNKWLSSLVPTLVVMKMSFTKETCTCAGKETAQEQAAVAREGPGRCFLKVQKRATVLAAEQE